MVQDITFLLRNSPLDSKLDLAILCDEDTVRHILISAINAGAKGPSRMYSLVSAIEKVVSFMTSVYKLEATSLFLVRTLMTQYNKMRHRNGPKSVAMTKSQLLLLVLALLLPPQAPRRLARRPARRATRRSLIKEESEEEK